MNKSYFSIVIYLNIYILPIFNDNCIEIKNVGFVMEANIKLSIVVPVYNAEEYLEKCLNSLVNQTIKNIEIILVNDGSTDNSLKICERFAQTDSRIKIFNQINSGQSKARNVGLDNASGEYVSFMDSDDWADLDYYEKLVNTAEKHNAEVSCASIIREKKHTKKMRINYKKETEYSQPQAKIDAAKSPDMCYVWNKVYKRELIEKLNLRFIEGMIFEDVDFVTRAVYFSNKIVTVPNTYYHYWANDNSTVKTMRKSDKKRADSLVAKKSVLKFFKEHNLTSNSVNLIKKKHCTKLFGITIMKMYQWETKRVYYLFGIIPVLEKITYA